MEVIFNSLDLYRYVMSKLNTDISPSQKLSLLFKAVQKDFPVDNYILTIFINYMRILTILQSDDIKLIYKTSKMKYFKYLVFWKEYMSYLISHNLYVDKIVQEGIKFLTVKEFDDKEDILRYLSCIMKSSTRDKYIIIWDKEWISIEDICEKRNLEEKGYGFEVEIKNIENLENNLINCKLPKNNWINCKLQEYSPSKKSYKTLQTPSTDSTNKFSYKTEKPSGNIKCRIADISIREDTSMWKNNNLENQKYSENKQEEKKEYFNINNKLLLKVKIIGKGGSSKVYKVFYKNEFYALKIINVELETCLKDLLIEEINLLKNLKGIKGIIGMVDYEVLTDNIYILLEYGEADLITFIKESFNNKDSSDKDIINYKYLHFNRIRYIWQEMLLIVKNIHDSRIIHGDLKPANFVFVKNRLKIIDFGISKPLNGNTTRVDMETVCGTLNYCAPELFFDKKKRRSSDIWSLGIILHEMWYGKTPLDNYKTYVEKKDNILNIQNELQINNSVDEVIFKCLEGDCRKRPSVNDLLYDKFTRGEG